MALTITLIGLLTYFYLGSGAQLECGERHRLATNYFKDLTFKHNVTGLYFGKDCTWTIEAQDSKIVNAEVTTTDLNFVSLRCSWNTSNITVYDGPDTASEEMLTWCMRETPTITSTGRYLTFQLRLGFLIFMSAEFNLRYKQEMSPEICSGTLSAFSEFKVFTSQGYPRRFQKNQNCSILIFTVIDHVIRLTVIDADVGSSCINIYDGFTSSAPLLHSICGTQVLTLTSTRISMLVKFSTGDNPTGKGFKMQYQSTLPTYDCSQGEMTADYTSQEIKSPFNPYKYNYPNNADCTWDIDTLYVGSVIYIQIIEFELEHTPGCTADYLQIIEGYESNGYSIGKWCGNRLPPNWQSTTQHVTIKFHSNGRVTMSGFKLGYSAIHNSPPLYPASSFNVGILAACIVSVIICISCIGSVIACRKNRHARHHNSSSQTQTIHRSHAQTARPARRGTQQTVYTIGGYTPAQNTIPANFLPPPTYDEVISKDIINGTGPSPPPYSTVDVSSDSPPRSSKPEEDNHETCDGATDVQTQL